MRSNMGVLLKVCSQLVPPRSPLCHLTDQRLFSRQAQQINEPDPPDVPLGRQASVHDHALKQRPRAE